MTNQPTDEILELLKPIPLDPLPENPLVSVLVANYNYAKYVGQATESVLSQSYGNLELIVCDDGSTDNSVQVIEEYARRDLRVHLVRRQNGGMASALNSAYHESKGEIICLLDADDYYLPEKLQAVLQAFRGSPGSGLLLHRLFRVDRVGRRRGVYPLLWHLPSGWLTPYLLKAGGELPIVSTCSGLCLRRRVGDLIFPMPERFRRNADAVVSGLASLMTRIVSVDAPLAEWREHGANMSTTLSVASSITPEYLERELQIQHGLWALQKEYLERMSPRAASALAPAQKRLLVLSMSYVLARLRRDGNGVSAYRRLVRDERFGNYNTVNRLFWRMSILLPSTAFCGAVRLLWGQSRLKQWVALARRGGLRVRSLVRALA